MGKLVLVTSFCVSFFVAIVVFLTRDTESLLDQFEKNVENEPRVVLEDFSFFRYDNHRLITTMSAKVGHFVEPNTVEIFASVKGTRYRKNRIESMRCEVATAKFDGESMHELMKADNPSLTRADVEDQVRLGFGENILRTEYAQYLAKEDVLRTRDPVQVDGPNRTFVGEEGFRYDLEREELTMTGDVKGVVSRSER